MILVNSEDLDLVNLLQDMDEKAIEKDSVMGTPANVDQNESNDSDDAEYSQIFNEDTIIMDPYKRFIYLFIEL